MLQKKAQKWGAVLFEDLEPKMEAYGNPALLITPAKAFCAQKKSIRRES